MSTHKLLSLALLLFTSYPALTAPVPVMNFRAGSESYTVEKIVDGFGGIWALEFLSPNTIIFNEINGAISTLNLSSGVTRVMKNPPKVYFEGQGGLLDIAVDPNFESNQYIYVTYSKKVGELQTTAMARSQLDLEKESFSPWVDLFVAKPASSTSHHYGSRIAFDKGGHIFFTVGERGNADLAQSLKAHNGKVIRLNLDGSVPSDNPFVRTPSALKEIWSYGHRNPQGIFFDETSNTLYEQEHGPMGGDEINIVGKGKNYGWPVISFGVDYSGRPVGNGERTRPGMEQAIKYFVPSIAPSSMMIYRGDKLKLFKDKFVSGSLALQHLNLVSVKDVYDACEDRLLLKLNERIRDVKEGPDQLVYVASDNGRIYVIKPGK